MEVRGVPRCINSRRAAAVARSAVPQRPVEGDEHRVAGLVALQGEVDVRRHARSTDPRRQRRASPVVVALQAGSHRQAFHGIVAQQPQRPARGVEQPGARRLGAVAPFPGTDGREFRRDPLHGGVIDSAILRPDVRGQQIARDQSLPVRGRDRHHLAGFRCRQRPADAVPFLAPETKRLRGRRGRPRRGFPAAFADVLDIERPVDHERSGRRHDAGGVDALHRRHVQFPCHVSGHPMAHLPEFVLRNHRRDVQSHAGKGAGERPVDQTIGEEGAIRSRIGCDGALVGIIGADLDIRPRKRPAPVAPEPPGQLAADRLGQPVGDARESERLRVDPHDGGDEADAGVAGDRRHGNRPQDAPVAQPNGGRVTGTELVVALGTRLQGAASGSLRC